MVYCKCRDAIIAVFKNYALALFTSSLWLVPTCLIAFLYQKNGSALLKMFPNTFIALFPNRVIKNALQPNWLYFHKYCTDEPSKGSPYTFQQGMETMQFYFYCWQRSRVTQDMFASQEKIYFLCRHFYSEITPSCVCVYCNTLSYSREFTVKPSLCTLF
jgi:hypothetical protein